MDEQRIRELRKQTAARVADTPATAFPFWQIGCQEMIALCDLALEALASRRAGRWRHCAIHGDIDGTVAWGCPECVRELRAEALRNRDVVRAAEEAAASHQHMRGRLRGCRLCVIRAALDAREGKGTP